MLFISVFGYFTVKALSNFYAYKKAVAPKMELTLDIFHFFLKNEMKKEWIKISASKPLSDVESPLKTFRITVKQKDLNTLNSDLPTSGKDHYIDGYLKVSDDSKIKKIKLRYRGDNNFHWLYAQKSLKIKFLAKDIYNMERKINLINPPLMTSIIDIVNYAYAKKNKIISPDFSAVRVFINGKYMGEYMYLSQIDESLLRKYKRMPGSIYSGDNAVRDTNGNWKLWQEPNLWVKKSSRNAEQKDIREDINLFISGTNKKNIEFYNFFNKYLDKDRFYKYFAIDTITGTFHHDEHHNHKIYFDPYKGKFEPIEWDMRFWTDSKYKDMSIYELIKKVKLNPVLEFERDKVAYNLLVSPDYKDYFSKNLLKLRTKLKKDLESDIYKDTAILHKLFPTWISVPFTMDEWEDSIASNKQIHDKRKSILINIYNKSQVEYKIDNSKLIFKVNGNSPIRVNLQCLFGKIYQDSNLNGIFDKNDKLILSKEIMYPGRKIDKNISTNWPEILGRIRNAPLFYTYFVKSENHISYKCLNATNAITGKRVAIKHKNFIVANISDSIHPWKPPSPKYKIKILQGSVEVNQTLSFDKYTKVIIDPNTTFVMDSNTSLYFYGKVTAIGTKKKPIKFIAKDPKKPWGLVAVQGKATTGSKFEYVEFENGSIDTHNLIHYTSPFNIHDMDWFEVRHCKIGKNFIGDDSMHIAYSKGIVDSCEFHDARSDGLDIDISDVNITNNVFYKSGNDGLDIMTTKMNASNNVFIDTGDKGISIGEWSDVNTTNSIFIRTYRGIEVKDKSHVDANNLIFVDSVNKAINLYNKNKRYDTGGFLNAGTIYLLGNTKIKADKRSSYDIHNRFEGVLPDLKEFQWYKDVKNTPYEKYIKEVEDKYAK